VAALVARGFQVTCFVRAAAPLSAVEGVEVRVGDVRNGASLARDGFRGERYDVLMSCLASRNGAADDAWAIDFKAHEAALAAAQAAGISHVVLLSAICVQKPRLPFQFAKLAFEQQLMASGLTWSIVRPTAYFKSLSGQIARVQAGKPFLLFGDGTLTACKPISDRDLADYLVRCVDDASLHNRVLPIGGPGPAITPREQGEELFRLTGRTPRFRHVPVAMMSVIIRVLTMAGRLSNKLATKADFARIGHYYATESMLVWDETSSRYNADATPETGSESLFDYYASVLQGHATAERGDHAVF
jgi:divinyl chlorophyllide a 8-vinyl-reductase